MSRSIACREMLSRDVGDGEVIVYDRWSYYYSGERGAKAIGTLHTVSGGWQGETAGPRSMTMPTRRSRLQAAQDVLDHHTGNCACTPTGWLCCHGPVPAEVQAAIDATAGAR